MCFAFIILVLRTKFSCGVDDVAYPQNGYTAAVGTDSTLNQGSLDIKYVYLCYILHIILFSIIFVGVFTTGEISPCLSSLTLHILDDTCFQ